MVIWIESGKTTLGIIYSLVEYTLQEAYDLIYLVYGIIIKCEHILLSDIFAGMFSYVHPGKSESVKCSKISPVVFQRKFLFEKKDILVIVTPVTEMVFMSVK